MRGHINTVGACFLVWGLVQLGLAVFIGLAFAGLGGGLAFLGAAEGDGELAVVGGVYGILGTVVALFAAVMALPSFIAGFGIRKRAGWGRIAGIVVGILSLSNMPLGTLLGVYALVTLFDKDVTAEFAG